MRYLSKDERREEILQAAMRVALTEGFAAMTVRRIATEAGVATGQVHAYYEEHMNSWDALAGLLLIVEAGGTSNAFLADNGLINGNLVLAGCVDVQARLSALLVGH